LRKQLQHVSGSGAIRWADDDGLKLLGWTGGHTMAALLVRTQDEVKGVRMGYIYLPRTGDVRIEPTGW